jgi:hypothetical protein
MTNGLNSNDSINFVDRNLSIAKLILSFELSPFVVHNAIGLISVGLLDS